MICRSGWLLLIQKQKRHKEFMMIYGFLGGFMIILMRNIGVYADGTVLAILLINLVNPIVDNIRPKALGKGVNNA